MNHNQKLDQMDEREFLWEQKRQYCEILKLLEQNNESKGFELFRHISIMTGRNRNHYSTFYEFDQNKGEISRDFDKIMRSDKETFWQYWKQDLRVPQKIYHML